MKRDEKLKTDLRSIFEDAFNRAELARAREPRQKGLLERLLEGLKRFWAGLRKESPKPDADGASYDDFQTRIKGAFEELLQAKLKGVQLAAEELKGK